MGDISGPPPSPLRTPPRFCQSCRRSSELEPDGGGDCADGVDGVDVGADVGGIGADIGGEADKRERRLCLSA